MIQRRDIQLHFTVGIVQIVVSLTGMIILDSDGLDLVLKADLYLHVSLNIVFTNGDILFTVNSYLIIRDLILV